MEQRKTVRYHFAARPREPGAKIVITDLRDGSDVLFEKDR